MTKPRHFLETSNAAPKPRRAETSILYHLGWLATIGYILNDVGTSAFAGVMSTLPLYTPRRRELKSFVTDGALILEQRAIMVLFIPYCDMQYAMGVLKRYTEEKFCYRSQRCICRLD
jgi:hypothetical protein